MTQENVIYIDILQDEVRFKLKKLLFMKRDNTQI